MAPRRGSPGFVVLWRLLPVAVVAPLVIGLLRLAGERAGYFSDTTGVAIMVLASIAGATGLVLWTAITLDGLDRRRRAVEHALRHSSEQHRALARNFPDGAIVLFDHDLRHLIADGMGLSRVGLSSDDMEGKTIWEVFPSEVCATIEGPYRAALEGFESAFDYPYRGRTYFVRVVPVRGEDGAILGGAATVRDVSARQRAEADLREANERFVKIFEHAPIGEAVVGTDGSFLQVNRALCELTGYSEGELLGLTFQDITHPDDLEPDLELVQRVLAGEIRTYQLEKRYLHRLGHVAWVLLSASLVRDESGAPLYFLSQIEDITERKRTHDAIAESQAQLAEAQAIAQVGSWEWRLSVDAAVWSDEMCRIFGVEPAAWGGVSYADFLTFVHPEDRETVEAEVERSRQTGSGSSIEYRIVRPDGSVRWLQGRRKVVMEDGVPVSLKGTVQDITERREAQERLREAERRYRTLVEQLPLAMYVRPLDMAGANLYVSPRVEEMLGYPVQDWETDPGLLARIVHPDDLERVLAGGKRVRITGEPFRDEYRYVARDGRIVWVQDETYLLRDESGKPLAVQGYLQDISSRKRAEQERDRLREELHHAQKIEAVGQLAGGVAHEFNNMLMAIRAHSELALERLATEDPVRRDVEQIADSAERAAAVTRQLLAFGRKQVLQVRPVDLNEVVHASVELLHPLLDREIDLVERLGESVPPVVADPAQIQQVIVNLVLNARDAISGAGTITISTAPAELGTELGAGEGVAGDYVALAIGDTGCGMDEETRSRIFEPFFTTKRAGEGTGLGLSTAYGIVRQGGGFLSVESEPGRGTTMTVALPLGLQSSGEPAADDVFPLAAIRRGRAVVADDEPLVRDVCAELLTRAGYDVRTAGSGKQTLSLLDEEPAELVLADVVMPGLSGSELASRVAASHPETTVIWMSGYAGDGLADIDRSGEELLFLQKPFTRSELEQTLQAVAAQPVGSSGGRTEITCVVADDHPSVLEAACRVLQSSGVQVVARSGDAHEALDRIVELRPRVALLDVSMPGLGGLECTRRVLESAPETRVLLYTGQELSPAAALAAGAQGVVLKGAPLAELVRAVQVAAAGGTYVDPSLGAALVPEPGPRPSVLSARETDVLRLVADGQTNDQVAGSLGISPETVQTHVHNAMKKLRAETRTQAVATALRQALIG